MLPLITGTSGWSFRFWNKTDMYVNPVTKKSIRGVAQLNHYAGTISGVELNASFYRLIRPETWLGWKKRAERFPAHWKFCVKMNRWGSHMKLLKDPETWWPQFWERACLLGHRLGPILIQLPPRFACTQVNIERLEGLEKVFPDHPFVFEFRNQSWKRDPIADLFRRTGWSVVITHITNKAATWSRRKGKNGWTKLDTGWNDLGLSGRVSYIRVHGTTGQYSGRYGGNSNWDILMKKVQSAVRMGKPVYVMFNNTDSINTIAPIKLPSAIIDAIELWHFFFKGEPNMWNTFQRAYARQNPKSSATERSKAYAAFLETYAELSCAAEDSYPALFSRISHN